MMTLAEHIIEATPERIKQENFVPLESPALERTDAATISSTMSWLAGYLADVDHLPSAAQIRSVKPEGWCPREVPGSLAGGTGGSLVLRSLAERKPLSWKEAHVRTASSTAFPLTTSPHIRDDIAFPTG